jgi:HEAT repeat protein
MRTISMKIASGNLLVLHCVVFYCLSVGAAGQSPGTKPSQEIINRRVAEIMDNALQRGTGSTPQGVRISPMRAEASMEEMDQIKAFGAEAIPPLSRYFDTSNYRAQHLAVRILSYIGGKGVIAPLTKAAEHSPSEVVRLSAVECLGQQLWEDAAPVVKRVASNDSNPLVREHAQRVIAAHENAPKERD